MGSTIGAIVTGSCIWGILLLLLSVSDIFKDDPLDGTTTVLGVDALKSRGCVVRWNEFDVASNVAIARKTRKKLQAVFMMIVTSLLLVLFTYLPV